MSILLPITNVLDVDMLNTVHIISRHISEDKYTVTITGHKDTGTSEYYADDYTVNSLAGKTVYLMADRISGNFPNTGRVRIHLTLDSGGTRYFYINANNLKTKYEIPKNVTKIRISFYVNIDSDTGEIVTTDNTVIFEGVRLTLIENEPYRSTDKVKLFLGEEKVKKVYLGDELVYSAGNIVTYYADGVMYQEEVDSDATCLNPATFTPEKDGCTFLGWREEKTVGDVLTEKIMGDEPITLYAMFKHHDTTAALTTSTMSVDDGWPHAFNHTCSEPIDMAIYEGLTVTAEGNVWIHFLQSYWSIGIKAGGSSTELMHPANGVEEGAGHSKSCSGDYTLTFALTSGTTTLETYGEGNSTGGGSLKLSNLRLLGRTIVG